MYIDQVQSYNDYTLKLSVVKTEEQAEQIDFDLRLCDDASKLEAIQKNLGSPEAKHYIVTDNVIFDEKLVNFQSPNVVSSLFLILGNGKVYRWAPVIVTPIRQNDKPICMVLKNTSDVASFNRRNSFRVPVDSKGKFHWQGYEFEPECFVMNVSHDGIAVMLKSVKGLPPVGENCAVHWNDGGVEYFVEGVVRRTQQRLGEQHIVGLALKKEPDEIRSLIQKIQTSRAISADLVEEKAAPGVRRLENWELEKDLEKNGLKPE